MVVAGTARESRWAGSSSYKCTKTRSGFPGFGWLEGFCGAASGLTSGASRAVRAIRKLAVPGRFSVTLADLTRTTPAPSTLTRRKRPFLVELIDALAILESAATLTDEVVLATPPELSITVSLAT